MAKQGWHSEGLRLCSQHGSPASRDALGEQLSGSWLALHQGRPPVPLPHLSMPAGLDITYADSSSHTVIVVMGPGVGRQFSTV